MDQVFAGGTSSSLGCRLRGPRLHLVHDRQTRHLMPVVVNFHRVNVTAGLGRCMCGGCNCVQAIPAASNRESRGVLLVLIDDVVWSLDHFSGTTHRRCLLTDIGEKVVAIGCTRGAIGIAGGAVVIKGEKLDFLFFFPLLPFSFLPGLLCRYLSGRESLGVLGVCPRLKRGLRASSLVHRLLVICAGPSGLILKPSRVHLARWLTCVAGRRCARWRT
jgi:hypothetical protein